MIIRLARGDEVSSTRSVSAIAYALRFVEIGVMRRKLDVVDAHLEALILHMLVATTTVGVHRTLVRK